VYTGLWTLPLWHVVCGVMLSRATRTPPGPNLARFFRVPVLAQFLAPNMAKSPERAARIRHALAAIRRGVNVRATSQQCGVSTSAIQRVKQARERPSVQRGTKAGWTKPPFRTTTACSAARGRGSRRSHQRTLSCA
jgi:hypothetical protein